MKTPQNPGIYPKIRGFRGYTTRPRPTTRCRQRPIDAWQAAPDYPPESDNPLLDAWLASGDPIAWIGLLGGEKVAAGYDRVGVEIPPGRPQIRFSESSGQWMPRGRILRCHIEDEEGSGTAVYIDDRKLELTEFGRLLNFYAGWGMRIAFVPADEVTEQPEIEVRDPPPEDENRE